MHAGIILNIFAVALAGYVNHSGCISGMKTNTPYKIPSVFRRRLVTYCSWKTIKTHTKSWRKTWSQIASAALYAPLFCVFKLIPNFSDFILISAASIKVRYNLIQKSLKDIIQLIHNQLFAVNKKYALTLNILLNKFSCLCVLFLMFMSLS